MKRKLSVATSKKCLQQISFYLDLFAFVPFYSPFQVKMYILCCQCKYSTCTYIFFWHVHLWMHITAHVSGLTPSSQAQSLVCMVITKQVGQEKEKGR